MMSLARVSVKPCAATLGWANKICGLSVCWKSLNIWSRSFLLVSPLTIATSKPSAVSLLNMRFCDALKGMKMIALSPISVSNSVSVLYLSESSMSITPVSLMTEPQQICNSLASTTAALGAVTSPPAKIVTALSFMSLNAFSCCLVSSVLRPTKLVSGKSLHSSSENLIEGCSTLRHVSSASARGVHLNVVTFCITKSLNVVKLFGH